MPIQKELGIKMANALLLELDVIPTVKYPTAKTLDIIDLEHYHGNFFQHDKDKVTIEPTKEALLEDIVKDSKSTIAFCCVSLQTDTRLTFDIDHVFPRERITEKQKLLFNYINKPENDVFAKAFMGEDPQDTDLEQKLGKYFKRDLKDNKIKATKWFADVCYNNLSNLFHLKHYINRGKSAATPQEWFEKNFPSKFMEELTISGGINEGIIMQQIFPKVVNGVELDFINLGKVKDKNGKEIGDDVIVYLHESKGIGLGEFIRGWFKANADTIIEESKDVHAINEKLTKMLADYVSKYQDNKEKGLKKFILTINQVLNFAEKRSTLNDDSSEDSEDTVLTRGTIFLQAISWAFNYMHSIKQMKKQFLELVEPSSRDVVKKYIYSSYINQLFSIGDEGVDLALNYLRIRCNALKQESEVRLLTESDAKTLLNNAKKEGDPKERVKIAEARAARLEEINKAKDERIAELEAALPPEKIAKLAAGSRPSFRPV